MYSTNLKPKVEKMFNGIRTTVNKIIVDTNSANEAVNSISRLVSSETASRSKTLLSDMLFDLNDALFETDFFASTARQNEFTALNLRQEIFSKYQFSATAVDYKEASRMVQALKVGGGTLVIGGIGEIGVVLIAELSFSSLVPLPVGALIVAALGAALVDYLAVEPNRSKKKFAETVDQYLIEAEQQFLNWFDEVERYFDKRVDEIKQTL